MNRNELTVYIVDDDTSVRNALALMLSVRSYRTGLFSDADSFLAAYRPDWRGCLLLDLRMPGTDGLTLQRKLGELGCDIPVVVITGHGDVESARAAFRSRAVDFLEKPLDHKRLLASIEEAFSLQAVESSNRAAHDELARKLAVLTTREREVMDYVVGGWHNRDIAQRLGISPRTVEVHKARVMQKLGVLSIPDLVRLTLRSGGNE
jgi:FixJ family two-component response regulator